MPESVENLEIWQEGIEVVKAMYKLTSKWPHHERFGLTSQVRRAAVSIPTNIAEGVGRGSRREAARFGQIALGSLYELDTLLHLAEELGYVEKSDSGGLRDRLRVLAKRISGYIRYQEDQHDSRQG